MKIAFITPYLPFPPDTGGKIRTFHLAKALSLHHSVDLFTVHYGSAPSLGPSLPQIFKRIQMVQLTKPPDSRSRFVRSLIDPLPRVVGHFQTPDAVREIHQQLSDGAYDLLVVDEICMASYVEGLRQPRIIMRQKIDSLHYLEIAATQPFGKERLLQGMEARRLRSFERISTAKFDAGVCCSADDAAVVNQLNPRIPVTVIGNGVDMDHFVPREEVAGPPTLLYTGTMHYYPNIDAVHFFFKEIHPHLVRLVPDVRILIVGHEPPPDILEWKRLPGVEITGSVPDIRPYLERCTATIVPLRLGGGTRLKIMESIAAARPVVSTSVGAEGVGMRDREHLLIADDPEKFAECAAELLRDPALRQQLTSRAQPFVAGRFSWKVLGERFEAMCRKVAEGRTT